METYSEGFKRSVLDALDSPKPLLAVIHQRTRTGFIGDVKTRDDIKIFEVMSDARTSLSSQLAEAVRKALSQN